MIGIKTHTKNRIIMPFESFQFFTFNTPQFNCVVSTTRNDRLTIGAKANTSNIIVMFANSFEFFSI